MQRAAAGGCRWWPPRSAPGRSAGRRRAGTVGGCRRGSARRSSPRAAASALRAPSGSPRDASTQGPPSTRCSWTELDHPGRLARGSDQLETATLVDQHPARRRHGEQVDAGPHEAVQHLHVVVVVHQRVRQVHEALREEALPGGRRGSAGRARAGRPRARTSAPGRSASRRREDPRWRTGTARPRRPGPPGRLRPTAHSPVLVRGYPVRVALRAPPSGRPPPASAGCHRPGRSTIGFSIRIGDVTTRGPSCGRCRSGPTPPWWRPAPPRHPTRS